MIFLYLLGVAALTWGLLKGIDWIHAVLRERRRVKMMAFYEAQRVALGRYAEEVEAITYHIHLLTPDRPSEDPFLKKARQEIDALTGPGEAVNYPRGQ
jgi:hypothetical protein